MFIFIFGNFLYYLRLADIDDFGIVGFLSLSTFQICRFYCAETPPLARNLAPIAREGMEGSRENRG